MRIVPLSALLMLSGCSILVPKWEGVWLLLEPVESDGTPQSDFCELDCDENFADATCPETAEFESEWTTTIAEKLSPAASFIEVFNGRGGEVFAVIRDEIYRGDATVKDLTLKWEGSTDSDVEDEHEAGYTFATTSVATSLETIVLTKGKGSDVDDATGTWAIESDEMSEYTESDEWDPTEQTERPVGIGQIPSDRNLVADRQGDNVNTPDGDECSGGDCELMTQFSCKFDKRKFSATFAGKYENGMYESLKPAAQPAGQ